MDIPANHRQPLTGQHFQVAIIGGGIMGMAIARECARAGKRTLLVEQNDFGSGTTSRTTRLVSALRVLERNDIAHAREMLRQRDRLVRERPHVLRPSHFLLALPEGGARSTMSVRAGLWLYRRMAGSHADSAGFEMQRKKLERALDAGRRWSLFEYEDAQCEFPERLVAEWATEAMRAGAVLRNHTQVLGVDLALGRARGLALRDWQTNREEKIEATWIVNATGPWADRLCQRSSIKLRKPMISGVRGSHIVVTRFPGAPDTGVYCEAVDGRPLHVLPWNDQILVGATEIADNSDPGKTVPALDEIEYLMQSLVRLFPKARLSQHEIRHAFAGIRAHPYEAKTEPSKLSWRYEIHDHADDGLTRMLSVVGGSLATATAAAEECATKLGLRVNPVKVAAAVDGDAILPLIDRWASELAEATGIGEDSAHAIVEWHGLRAKEIARLARSGAEMRAPLCPHSQHIVAEAVDAYMHEQAMTLGDVLLRRVPVALGPCWSESCSREAALRLSAVMGWNDETTGANLEALEMERASFLRRPRTGMKLGAAAD
jgi:glycerol-3-phosphate dehydrogenase